MFLLVSGRHVGAHLDVHLHGVFIQFKFGGTVFQHILHKKYCSDLNLGAGESAYLPSIFSQILDLPIERVFIFILICFEWCDIENQCNKRLNAEEPHNVEQNNLATLLPKPAIWSITVVL